jgi:hypothetical protein
MWALAIIDDHGTMRQCGDQWRKENFKAAPSTAGPSRMDTRVGFPLGRFDVDGFEAERLA